MITIFHFLYSTQDLLIYSYMFNPYYRIILQCVQMYIYIFRLETKSHWCRQYAMLKKIAQLHVCYFVTLNIVRYDYISKLIHITLYQIPILSQLITSNNDVELQKRWCFVTYFREITILNISVRCTSNTFIQWLLRIELNILYCHACIMSL